MPVELTILYSEDAKDLAHLIRKQYDVPARAECLEEMNFPLKPSNLLSLTKSRRFLFLLSPEMLNFLRKKAQDMFNLVGLLNPSTIVCAFCYGANEDDVRPIHKEVLISYEQWLKVFLNGKDDVEISALALKKMLGKQATTNAFEEVNNGTGLPRYHVKMVPDTVTKEQRLIYLILDNPMDDIRKMTVTLNRNSTDEVTPIAINPYVAYFSVPDIYLSSSGVIKVKIYYGSKLLTEKELQCNDNSEFRSTACSAPLLSHDGTSRDDGETVVTPSSLSEADHDRRGLDAGSDERSDDLNIFFEHPFITATTWKDSHDSSSETGMEDSLEKRTRKHLSKLILPTKRQRSLSLPSPLPNQDESRVQDGSFYESMDENDADDEFFYMDMTGQQEFKLQEKMAPHERMLLCLKDNKGSAEEHLEGENGIEGVVSGNGRERTAVDKREAVELADLSGSQRELVELMQAFKRGVKTISEVEHSFQDWHQKHRESLRLQNVGRSKQAYGKMQRGQSFGFLDLKNLLKAKRKDSKEKGYSCERGDKHSKEVIFNDQRRNKKTYKSSGSSRSSGGSANSEIFGSNGTFSAESADDSGRKKKAEDLSTVWFRAMSPKSQQAYCPLFVGQPPKNELKTSKAQFLNSAAVNIPKINYHKLEVIERASNEEDLSPSPDYVVPNSHLRTSPAFFFNRGAEKKLLQLPKIAANDVSQKQTLPYRKISAPSLRITPPESEALDTAGRYRRGRTQEKPRKSLSSPQLTESLFQQPLYLELIAHN